MGGALAGRSISSTVTAGDGSRARVRVWLLERLGHPESTAVVDSPVQSNGHLLSQCAFDVSLRPGCEQKHVGHAGRDEFGVFEDVRLEFLGCVDDLRCAVRVGRHFWVVPFRGKVLQQPGWEGKRSNEKRTDISTPIDTGICILSNIPNRQCTTSRIRSRGRLGFLCKGLQRRCWEA